MSRHCVICDKKSIGGNSIRRRGKAKREGGVGKKTTGITKRRFLPNLQKRRLIINGKVERVLVCAKCIKSGKLNFATRKPNVSNNK
ncbi:MAG: 50S ribosomal protein L28 [Candidatus Omnitrophica bacterium]|jgi:large subunit ribosomal protein L28|nr:50S ribosomal protein L28 [Candidatus Omnitrophota bacterium]